MSIVQTKILCINFGLYSRTITVGFTGGVRVFLISGVGTLDLLYESINVYLDVHSAECIDSTVSLVQFRFPRHLILYDFLQKREVERIEFKENIITFKINTRLILVRLSDSIHALDAGAHTPLRVFFDVSPDSYDLALSFSCFAYPSIPNTGYVSVYAFDEACKMECVNLLKSPDDVVGIIEISSSGELIALAHGSVIYVYKVHTGQNVFQFCRGLAKNDITSLFFADDNYLLCSSNSDTVHVFDMNSSGSSISSYLSDALSYCPFGSSFVMQRSAMKARIPTHGFQTKVYFWRHGGMCWMVLASYCGQMHMFIVDVPNKQCILSPIYCHILRVGSHHVTILQKEEA